MRGEEEEGAKWRRRRRETSKQAWPLDNNRVALSPMAVAAAAAIPRGGHKFLGKEDENFLRNGLNEKKRAGWMVIFFFGHAAPQGHKLESVIAKKDECETHQIWTVCVSTALPDERMAYKMCI